MFDYYRRLFIEGSNSIYWGGETTTRYWEESTLFLYFLIIFFVIIIGKYIEKKQARIILNRQNQSSAKYKSINSLLKFIFAILIIILGFRHRSVGIDTIVYSNAIENAVSLSQLFNESTVEPLFQLFQYFIHLIFNNGTIGVFIYSFITIALIYSGLKINEQNISLFISLTTYVCLYYFPSFNLIRISFAASLIFYFFHYLLEVKYKRFALIIIIVSLIHYSSLVMFLPLGIYIIYRNHRILALTLISLISFTIILGSIILGDYLAIINRYSGYIDSNESNGSVGIMLFFDYFPCILVCFYLIKNKIKNTWSNLMICFTLSAITIRLMAYYIAIAGRLHVHFMILTMILLPYWIFYFKHEHSKYYIPMLWICVIWGIFRLHIYFSGYLSSDGIMPYHFFWNNF